MYKSAALSAALLMDGQPGWLRAGGCMFAQLPLLVSEVCWDAVLFGPVVGCEQTNG